MKRRLASSVTARRDRKRIHKNVKRRNGKRREKLSPERASETGGGWNRGRLKERE